MRILLLCLAPLFAYAQAPATPPPGASEHDADPNWTAGEVKIRYVEVGVQLFGLVNGSFTRELDDEDKQLTITDPTDSSRQDTVSELLYPGFGGVGGGGGLSLIAMYRGIVGLQLEGYFSIDQGGGKVNDQEFTLSQTAFHLPIFLKLSAPLTVVRPFAFGGPEIVFPGDPELDNEVVGFEIKGQADTYLSWGFGVGFEFVLPPAGPVDIRIPLTFRGSYHPVGDGISDRADYDLVKEAGSGYYIQRGATYKTEWELQAAVALGVAVYFL